jgi:hypothetical protein
MNDLRVTSQANSTREAPGRTEPHPTGSFGTSQIPTLHSPMQLIPFLDVFTYHLIPFHREFAAYIFQPLTLEFWIVWVLKNKGCMLFAVPESMP